MIELFKKLIECLTQEAEHYCRLAEIAEKQKDILVSGKVETLPENLRLEEKEVFALTPLIGKRNDLLTSLGKTMKVASLNLVEAIDVAPIEIVEEYKKAVIELVQAAKHLESVNGSNEKLLNNALSYVNFTLKVLNGGNQKKAFTPMAKEEETRSSYVNRVV